MLEHGGNLQEAIRRYGRPASEWIDLSTGINPVPYAAPALAADAWHRLPEERSALVEAAQRYYRAPHMLPVAGTQAAIQALPRLRAPSRVHVSAPSYAEHAYQWRQGGHTVREVAFNLLEQQIDNADVVVVCNPNNPTGETVAPAQLLTWAERLAARGGWLVVDEAFGDTAPALSVASQAGEYGRPGLIVLRSVGKFFGLAGLRLGFVAAEDRFLTRLRDWLGPWTVSGPAQEIGIAALEDGAWQQRTQLRLQHDGMRLQQLLEGAGIASSGTALFQWWPEPHAEACAEHFAHHGIWVRLFRERARGIRLGLPAGEAHWERLRDAAERWKEERS